MLSTLWNESLSHPLHSLKSYQQFAPGSDLKRKFMFPALVSGDSLCLDLPKRERGFKNNKEEKYSECQESAPHYLSNQTYCNCTRTQPMLQSCGP